MLNPDNSAFQLAKFRADRVGGEFEARVIADSNPQGSFGDASTLRRLAIIDDCLRSALRFKPDSLILNLGSGFCSRWQYFPETRWIQVDRPHVISKWESLQIPDMQFVSCDLNNFDPAKYPSDIVIAEGILVYLPFEKVIEMLKAMKGRLVIFDADSTGSLARKSTSKFFCNEDIKPYLKDIYSYHTSVEFRNLCEVHCGLIAG